MYEDIGNEGEISKIITLWLNSTLGVLSIMAARLDTRGPWMD